MMATGMEAKGREFRTEEKRARVPTELKAREKESSKMEGRKGTSIEGYGGCRDEGEKE